MSRSGLPIHTPTSLQRALNARDFQSLNTSDLPRNEVCNGLVIYTSGSTGQPKGVMIKHRAVATAIDSIISFEGRESMECRTLQFSNYVFDASVYDIFVPLSCGHTLCMAPTDRLLSELTNVINEMNASHCFLTPTVARLLDPKTVPSLKVLTIGGEAVTPDVCEIWSNGHTLLIAYGPTETSIMVTMTKFDPNEGPRSIGRPVSSANAFVLDPNSPRLLPWGVVGELCICGPQLAEGYLERPKQTEAAFVDFSTENISRIYRTGDLARWLPNGELECMGRKDNQIKIHGYRVELGEIEQAMLKASCTKDVVVVLAEQRSKPYLVSFVVFSSDGFKGFVSLQDHSSDSEELKRSLNCLTHYMRLKYVILFESMPRLLSGKADRKELKKRASSLEATELSNYVLDSSRNTNFSSPPEKAGEKILQTAWANVLSLTVDELDLEANFLALGGDSISAINLVSVLRKQGYILSVGETLTSTNLKDMAARSIGLQRSGYEYIYACPPGQAAFLAQGATSERFWVLMATRQLPGTTNVAAWVETVRQLTETNDILRTTFLEYEGEWYGAVRHDATPTVSVHDVTSQQVKPQILEELWHSRFVVGKPFIRYMIMRNTNGIHELVIKMDHGLYDGTLLRVFDDHFKAIQHHRPITEFTPFRDFATHISASDKGLALNFWSAPDQRPIDFRYPNILNPKITAMEVLAVDSDIDSYAAAIGQTPAIIFQAAFQIWLSLRSGRIDVSFDYLYTGRNVDLANPYSINGTCANFLPLRSQILPQLSLSEYLSKTSMSFWKATENDTVGLRDICLACKLDSKQVGNTALFLFQPFDPPSKARMGEIEDMRWLAMANSEVRMPQP